ncbi:M28 family peptidase [Bacteroidota bacterium]
MKYHVVLLLLLSICYINTTAQTDEQIIAQIFEENLGSGHAYKNLEYLTKRIGNRINGSPQLAAAIEYSKQLMLRYNFDTVYLQPVMTPNWKRGKPEIVRIINSTSLGNKQLNCISFGNSIGTGPDGIFGEVLEFKGLESLKQAEEDEIRGKIVFLNKSINQKNFDVLGEYGKNIGLRQEGASVAAGKGAIAFILRSLSTGTDHIAHTGQMSYTNADGKIPALAIGYSEANLLSELVIKEPEIQLYIETHCERYNDVMSYNLIGELKGTGYPDEVIVVGGHIDSWDVGEGAHDDGAGCVQSIEVVRTFKSLKIDPKHTIRVIL